MEPSETPAEEVAETIVAPPEVAPEQSVAQRADLDGYVKQLVAADVSPDKVEPDFLARMIPGEGNPEDSVPADWRPCGRADGVIFFDKVHYTRSIDGSVEQVVVKPGRERQALRYLLSPKALPEVSGPAAGRVAQALDYILMKPGQLGMCEPNISFLLARNPSIECEAVDAGHPLQRKFLSSRAGIDANQPQHASRWRVVKAEDGIWCVFYV